MQVRAFIKPDQVSLMLSAGDWLSDRLQSVFGGVCVYVCVCLNAGKLHVHVIIDILPSENWRRHLPVLL